MDEQYLLRIDYRDLDATDDQVPPAPTIRVADLFENIATILSIPQDQFMPLSAAEFGHKLYVSHVSIVDLRNGEIAFRTLALEGDPENDRPDRIELQLSDKLWNLIGRNNADAAGEGKGRESVFLPFLEFHKEGSYTTMAEGYKQLHRASYFNKMASGTGFENHEYLTALTGQSLPLADQLNITQPDSLTEVHYFHRDIDALSFLLRIQHESFSQSMAIAAKLPAFFHTGTVSHIEAPDDAFAICTVLNPETKESVQRFGAGRYLGIENSYIPLLEQLGLGQFVKRGQDKVLASVMLDRLDATNHQLQHTVAGRVAAELKNGDEQGEHLRTVMDYRRRSEVGQTAMALMYFNNQQHYHGHDMGSALFQLVMNLVDTYDPQSLYDKDAYLKSATLLNSKDSVLLRIYGASDGQHVYLDLTAASLTDARLLNFDVLVLKSGTSLPIPNAEGTQTYLIGVKDSNGEMKATPGFEKFTYQVLGQYWEQQAAAQRAATNTQKQQDNESSEIELQLHWRTMPQGQGEKTFIGVTRFKQAGEALRALYELSPMLFLSAGVEAPSEVLKLSHAVVVTSANQQPLVTRRATPSVSEANKIIVHDALLSNKALAAQFFDSAKKIPNIDLVQPRGNRYGRRPR
jgi:hypothetical protein